MGLLMLARMQWRLVRRTAIGWIVPAGLLFLLFRLTGIPATEEQALRSRADYAEYQRTTSVFVPLPPRRQGGGMISSPLGSGDRQ